MQEVRYRNTRKKIIRLKNGAKYVNLCKIDLVANVCLHIAQNKDFPSGHYLCSDAQVQTWSDIAQQSQYSLSSKVPGLESKIFSVQKLQKLLKSKIDWDSFVYCVKNKS